MDADQIVVVEWRRFEPGRVVATPRALATLAAAGVRAHVLLARHLAGDWGEVPPEDARANELGVREGARVLSAYRLPTGARVWLITEADRSASVFLLPSEY